MLGNDLMYGSYRNKSFADVYPSVSDFLTDYKASGIYTSNSTNRLSDNDATTLYYLLYARYGNSIVASSDLTRFSYNLYAIIFQYGPSWHKKLEIQNALQQMTASDIIQGSKAIYNHAYNPSTTPSTSTLTELTAINEQNTTNYKRSQLEAYGELYALLNNDETGIFLDRFKPLFLKVVQPELPLWYCEEAD